VPASTRPLAPAIALACVLCALIVPGLAEAACPDESAPAQTISTEQHEQAVLCLVNERRAQTGRGPVAPQSNLDRAASRYAEVMVARGFFSHRSPSGRSPQDRAEASGYARGGGRWIFGENLGWGYGSQTTPLSIVEGWMNSPPHRQNLLRGRFRDIGIGVAMGTPGPTPYPAAVTVVNIFGRRLI
jgi:uncharacterized protein YkwD